MYGRITLTVIASAVVFGYSHSWLAGLLGGLLALVLMLAFSGIGRLRARQRSNT